MSDNSDCNDDQKILDYLERRDPCEFDDFMDIVEKRIAEILPELKRVIDSYGSNFDADEVLSKALDKAIRWLWDQFMGKETPFEFSRSHQLHTLDAWLLRVIGKPGSGPKSGVIGPAIQSFKRHSEKFQSIDLNPNLIVNEQFYEAVFDDCDMIEKAVLNLPVRQQFVIRLAFDLHKYHVLTVESIVELAKEIVSTSNNSSRFSVHDVSKIRRRAKTLRFDDSLRNCMLSQQDIGTLLDISSRQVRNLKADALEALRKNLVADPPINKAA